MRTTADDYARFLRKLLGGQLHLGALLGTHAVCTNPATCATALHTPIRHRAAGTTRLGHWVEDDPPAATAPSAAPAPSASTPGSTRARRWYGIVARAVGHSAVAIESADCGRLIRKAWVTGIAQ